MPLRSDRTHRHAQHPADTSTAEPESERRGLWRGGQPSAAQSARRGQQRSLWWLKYLLLTAGIFMSRSRSTKQSSVQCKRLNNPTGGKPIAVCTGSCRIPTERSSHFLGRRYSTHIPLQKTHSDPQNHHCMPFTITICRQSTVGQFRPIRPSPHDSECCQLPSMVSEMAISAPDRRRSVRPPVAVDERRRWAAVTSGGGVRAARERVIGRLVCSGSGIDPGDFRRHQSVADGDRRLSGRQRAAVGRSAGQSAGSGTVTYKLLLS